MGLVVRRSPDDGANGAVLRFISSIPLSDFSSLLLAQSSGPTTAQRTVVRPIWTRALPFVHVEFVRGDSWIVIRRISFGFRPSFRRLDRARRSVLRKELMFLFFKLLLLFVCSSVVFVKFSCFRFFLLLVSILVLLVVVLRWL